MIEEPTLFELRSSLKRKSQSPGEGARQRAQRRWRQVSRTGSPHHRPGRLGAGCPAPSVWGHVRVQLEDGAPPRTALPLGLGQAWNRTTQQNALQWERLGNEQRSQSEALAAVPWEVFCPADLAFAECKEPKLSGSEQTGWVEGRTRPRLAVFTRPDLPCYLESPRLSGLTKGINKKLTCVHTHTDKNAHTQAGLYTQMCMYTARTQTDKCICTYTGMCTCLHIQRHATTHRYMHMYTCMHMHACLHTGMHPHAQWHTNAHMYIHIVTCTHRCIPARAHTHTQTYTRIYILAHVYLLKVAGAALS